mmetsp:Transcript_2904/g.5474  ORF Transcript_2904/g.5474 Transcript_2904/m.5474 type:complete len:217 (+) Transcript_2904:2330-2980(+)
MSHAKVQEDPVGTESRGCDPPGIQRQTCRYSEGCSTLETNLSGSLVILTASLPFCLHRCAVSAEAYLVAPVWMKFRLPVKAAPRQAPCLRKEGFGQCQRMHGPKCCPAKLQWTAKEVPTKMPPAGFEYTPPRGWRLPRSAQSLCLKGTLATDSQPSLAHHVTICQDGQPENHPIPAPLSASPGLQHPDVAGQRCWQTASRRHARQGATCHRLRKPV